MKESIQKLIRNGKFDKAIEKMHLVIPDEKQNELIQIEVRFNELNKQLREGVLETSQANIIRNKITTSLISFYRNIRFEIGDNNLANEIIKLKERLQLLESKKDVNNLLPIGSIIPFGGYLSFQNSEEDRGKDTTDLLLKNNWMLCDGRELLKNEYPDLYNVLQGAWGKTKFGFNLPDLRGQFLRGVDYMKGVDPDFLHRKNCEGLSDVGSIQEDATKMPNKKFTGTTDRKGAHKHPYPTAGIWPRTWQSGGNSRPGHPKTAYVERGYTESVGDHQHIVIVGGGDSETRPKNANVNFIIRVR